jgi:hypothetical protein
MRDYKNIIKEAELLASSPESVVAYLKERSSQDGDDALEQALLGLNHPLIDLALAQYGRSIDVLKSLFHRRQLALRVAVLANQAVTRWAYNWPVDLFENATGREDKDLIKAYLADASDEELCALFQNPELDDEFICSLLRGNDLWTALGEEKQLFIVYKGLSLNRRMKAPYNDHGQMDGFVEHRYESVFCAAWELAERVPVTGYWANVLNYLFINLIPLSSIEQPLELATRWYPSSDKERRKDAKSKSISVYQGVRRGLARLALAERKTDAKTLLASEDIALRAAVYSCADLTSEQIAQAYNKDGALGFKELLSNKHLWKHADKRRALHEIAWSLSKNDENPFSSLNAPNDYNFQENLLEKEYPDWFRDEEDQLEELVTKEDFEKLTDRTILPNFQYLSSKINILENNLKYIFWFSFAVLLIAIAQYF